MPAMHIHNIHYNGNLCEQHAPFTQSSIQLCYNLQCRNKGGNNPLCVFAPFTQKVRRIETATEHNSCPPCSRSELVYWRAGQPGAYWPPWALQARPLLDPSCRCAWLSWSVPCSFPAAGYSFPPDGWRQPSEDKPGGRGQRRTEERWVWCEPIRRPSVSVFKSNVWNQCTNKSIDLYTIRSQMLIVISMLIVILILSMQVCVHILI